MRILMIFGFGFIMVFGIINVRDYLLDNIQQYYENKEKNNRRKHILEMKL